MLTGQDMGHKYTWDCARNTRVPSSFFSKPRFRFDRIYVHRDDAVDILRFSLITSKVQETHPSDHFALLVTLRLR